MLVTLATFLRITSTVSCKPVVDLTRRISPGAELVDFDWVYTLHGLRHRGRRLAGAAFFCQSVAAVSSSRLGLCGAGRSPQSLLCSARPGLEVPHRQREGSYRGGAETTGILADRLSVLARFDDSKLWANGGHLTGGPALDPCSDRRSGSELYPLGIVDLRSGGDLP